MLGIAGAAYHPLRIFPLEQTVFNDALFDKVFLGAPGYAGPFSVDGRSGLAGWESLVDGSALAPVLKKRLDALETKLAGYDMETSSILSWHDRPNMSAADFLQQPSALRRDMVFYKDLLNNKIEKYNDFGTKEESKLLITPYGLNHLKSYRVKASQSVSVKRCLIIIAKIGFT